VVWIWCARVAWALLPITAGTAIADALDSWSDAPARVATVLLWLAWSSGLVALFAPRPWGLTLLRVAGPAAVLVAIASVPSASAVAATVAVATTVFAAAAVLSAPIACAAVNAPAYGDEIRYPLRVPLPLLLVAVPVAVVLTGAGVAAGPLLLADERLVAGIVALAVGIPAVVFLARALHALSRRWLVLVPAGAVVVDPLTLLDPVLLRREQIAVLRAATDVAVPADVVDLRLGTTLDSVAIMLRAPEAFGRRQGRRGGAVVRSECALVAPVRSRELLAAARARRIPVA
jgi:hypothetical protein